MLFSLWVHQALYQQWRDAGLHVQPGLLGAGLPVHLSWRVVFAAGVVFRVARRAHHAGVATVARLEGPYRRGQAVLD